MSVSTLVTTYEDLWSVGTCDERSQGPNCTANSATDLLTQRQHSTLQQTMVHYTSGGTELKPHNSLTYNSIRQFYRGYS